MSSRSPTGSGQTEAERVREAYARRAELGLDARYEYWEPANLFIYQARERAMLHFLRKAGMLPMVGRMVLDVGCGDGAVLREMLRFGAEEQHLHGIDLLPDRVERARSVLPAAQVEVGDSQQLSYGDETFDLVLGFTVLSSVLDEEARKRVAGEMRRVTRRGGLVLVYDFRLNPLNRDVRPVTPAQLRALFEGSRVDHRSTTLAPPLVRTLIRAPGGWIACNTLDVLPFLRTHYVAAVHV